jgi:hypothetical protein
MYYNLQYGLLDIKDEHIPNNGIGAFLTDLNEVMQYVQWEWHKYNARTQHYERLYQIVELLEVLPDNHIAEYKKLDEVKEQHNKKQDERKRKAM